jgi:hypothetical protein
MIQKNYDDIVKKYPDLFEHGEDSLEPFALFGFECDSGWYDIIDKACEIMYRRYENIKSTVTYWENTLLHPEEFLARSRKNSPHLTDEQILKDRKEFLDTQIKKLEDTKAELPKVVQAKEKFGTLRLYIEGGKDSDYAITDFAESMSEVTCEVCGNAGKTYHMQWHKTLCKEHAIARYGQEAVEKYDSKHN